MSSKKVSYGVSEVLRLEHDGTLLGGIRDGTLVNQWRVHLTWTDVGHADVVREGLRSDRRAYKTIKKGLPLTRREVKCTEGIDSGL